MNDVHLALLIAVGIPALFALCLAVWIWRTAHKQEADRQRLKAEWAALHQFPAIDSSLIPLPKEQP